MSTLKADAVTAQSTNGDLVISGNGTGVPDIEAGFKVDGTVEKLTGIAPSTSGNVLTSDGTDWTSAAAGGGPSQATQAALEAETNEDTYAPPDLIKHSPGVAKLWITFDGTGTPSITDSYNVTSLTDDGTGLFTITVADDFSTADYTIVGGAGKPGITDGHSIVGTSNPVAGSFKLRTLSISNNPTDLTHCYTLALGDQ